MCIVRRAVYPGAVGVALAILAALIVPGFAQEKGKTVKPQPIPLDSVYVTSEQKGLKRVAIGHGNFDRQVLEDLYKTSIKIGPSNVFLVRGADIGEAVKASLAAFSLGDRADEPISTDKSKKAELIWAVAYFGVSGSDPEAWVVSGIERAGNRVRVSFTKRLALTDDLQPYFAWVSLGVLEEGKYTLELYEAGDQEVKLTRIVRVGK